LAEESSFLSNPFFELTPSFALLLQGNPNMVWNLSETLSDFPMELTQIEINPGFDVLPVSAKAHI
jgi:hypothetical protein